LFSAASTPPAPKPYGTAKTQSCQKEVLQEKPYSAVAVSAQLAALTLPAPNRRVILSLHKLETAINAEISMDITPAADTGAPSTGYIAGQADPNSESGNPKEINDKYMIHSKQCVKLLSLQGSSSVFR